MSTYTAST